jgi:para-aminobenzoate synthetase/4-amino-4-deoxychorismate lyase
MSFSSLYQAVLFDPLRKRWLCFAEPVAVFSTVQVEEVRPLLRQVTQDARAQQLWGVGWLSYEAAPAFNAHVAVWSEQSFPKAWFALFKPPLQLVDQPWREHTMSLVPCWQPSITQEEYVSSIADVKRFIGRGDTYQVNFSYRLTAPAPNDERALFSHMVQVQRGEYSAFIDAGRFVVSSASPELFFRRSDGVVVCEPMKGTAQRGRFTSEDQVRAEQLRSSAKECAENVMIVDMVRNDLAHSAARGSITTAAQCDLTRYPRVWQMTRRIEARCNGDLDEILCALYPAASITGAPKRRTMEIIKQLERGPRRIYTGSIGWIEPDGHECFNVAIRTALVDRVQGTVEYGVGSGIVWDAQADAEYEECQAKAQAVVSSHVVPDLFETLRWEPAVGFVLYQRHIERLVDSACYFGWAVDLDLVHGELKRCAESLSGTHNPQRVKLFLSADGSVRSVTADVTPLPDTYTVSLAKDPVDSRRVELFHKTTDRRIYDDAQGEVSGTSDVLLWNQRGELTESRIGNLAVVLKGVLVTPPQECGLLPGCFRAQMLAEGRLREEILSREDLAQADGVYLMNALRGLWKVQVVWGLKRHS